MQKIDLKKISDPYFKSTSQPVLLSLPPRNYLSLQGKGDPSSADFATHLEALYATAYALKFICKAEGKDFMVPPLEGLWWYDEERWSGLSIEDAAVKVPRSEWEYQLLIMVPDFVHQEQCLEAIENAWKKKKNQAITSINPLTYHEPLVVQVLHTGPYSTEPDSLRILKEFTDAKGLKRAGRHHEIYLSDNRKTPPERLKTLLREPVH